MGIGRVAALVLALAALPALAEEAPRVAIPRTYFDPFGGDFHDGRTRITGYAGVVAQNEFSQIVRFDPNFGSQPIFAVGIGREIARWADLLSIEVEANTALAFEPTAIADFRLMIGPRLLWFPWNRWLPTTFAMLLGPSYLTGQSRYETEQGEIGRWSVGVIWEFTFALPEWRNTSVIFRFHHRSNERLTELSDASPSDWLTLGLHYRFCDGDWCLDQAPQARRPRPVDPNAPPPVPSFFRPFDLTWADGRWLATGYAGVVAPSLFSQSEANANDPSIDGQPMIAASLGREIAGFRNLARLEWEIAATVQAEPQWIVGLRASIGARWMWFPWNRWVPTTTALLVGPSWLSAHSKYEDELGNAGPWAWGATWEVTAGLPSLPNWQLVGRVFHRSNARLPKLSEGTSSDWLTLGVRYRF
jgi:hypothetical protein